ncbi:MAG: DUF3408 domain-containing protein [Bacteroides uniformis]|nr:DUF3408 domain-containing protein [Bacteroides uniformis]
MERTNVELTKEQCNEIIENIATASLHKIERGKSKVETDFKNVSLDNFSIDDIMPEQTPSQLECAQTEAAPSAIGEQPLASPTIQRRASSKQRRLSLEEYRNTYLKVPVIKDRKPVFLSCEVRDRLDDYVHKLGGRKMSVSGLLENIARQHLALYDEDFEQWRKL